MCGTNEENGLMVVRVYTFTNLIILIFSIVHFVVAYNPSNYISDTTNYMNNYEGDVALNFIGAATRFMICFLFNLMNSIILWRQFLTGGLKERIVFEAICIILTYFWLVIESIILMINPGSFVSSVVPLFVICIILFLIGIYFMVVIIINSDTLETKYIKSMTVTKPKPEGQNIEINFQPPQVRVVEEEGKENAKESQMKETKGGTAYNMVNE